MIHLFKRVHVKGAKLVGYLLTVKFRVEDGALAAFWPPRSKLKPPSVLGEKKAAPVCPTEPVLLTRVDFEPSEVPRKDTNAVDWRELEALMERIEDPRVDTRCVLSPIGRGVLVKEGGGCGEFGEGYYDMHVEFALDLNDREHLAAPGSVLDLVVLPPMHLWVLVEPVQMEVDDDSKVVSLGAERARRQGDLGLDDHRAEMQVEDLLREKAARLLKRLEGDGVTMTVTVAGDGGGPMHDVLREVADQMNQASILTPEQLAVLREAEAHDNALEAAEDEDDGFEEGDPDDPDDPEHECGEDTCVCPRDREDESEDLRPGSYAPAPKTEPAPDMLTRSTRARRRR